MPGTAVWCTDVVDPLLILPDGCLDLVWTGTRVLVAGPDSRARRHTVPGRHHGLRFASGRGPRVLGVPADELRDRVVPLDAVWGPAAARDLTDRVATDPAVAFDALRREAPRADAFGDRMVAAALRGASVTATADAFGVGERTLHRWCRAGFGYGPQHLARVLRLQRALTLARGGTPWAEVAARVGYADQPHLARELPALAGATPGELLGQDGDPPGEDRDPPGQDRGAKRSTGLPSGSWTTA